MWSNLLNHFLKHMGVKLYEEGVNEGLKKVSELSGSKAKQIAAATQVADQFLSALKGYLLEEARAHCDASLIVALGERGLEGFFSDLDLRSITWNWMTVDDSSKSNKWGTLYDVKLIGKITYITLWKRSQNIDDEFSLRMLKRTSGWKVLGLEFPA
jgi:hypothetical protein